MGFNLTKLFPKSLMLCLLTMKFSKYKNVPEVKDNTMKLAVNFNSI